MLSFPLHIDEDHVRVMWAVARLVGRGGIEALSMRTIAAEAAMSTGTLVHRFGNRDDLLTAVADVACLGLGFASCGLDPVDQLLPHEDGVALLERTYLALRELARSRPGVASAVARREDLDRRSVLSLGVPAAQVRGGTALVDGLREAMHHPSDPLPREQATWLLRSWVLLVSDDREPGEPDQRQRLSPRPGPGARAGRGTRPSAPPAPPGPPGRAGC